MVFLSACGGPPEGSVITTGKVVDISKKGIYRSAIIRFKTKEGKVITFKSMLDVNVDIFKYKIGDDVEIIYHPDDPFNSASINTLLERKARQYF